MVGGPIGVGGVDEGWAPKLVDSAVPFELDDQPAILDERNGLVFPLAPTAVLAVQYFDGSVSLGELADDVADVFAVERSTTASDLLALARELARMGMLDGVSTTAVAQLPGSIDGTCGEPSGDDGPSGDRLPSDCILAPPDP